MIHQLSFEDCMLFYGDFICNKMTIHKFMKELTKDTNLMNEFCITFRIHKNDTFNIVDDED
jgi:hypothetical protein